MKVLIWILSGFAVVLLNEILGMAIGFKLGYVIVTFLACSIATALCKVLIKEDSAKAKKGKGRNASPVGNNAPIPGGWTCPSCGTNHEPSTNFCDRCGTPKSAAAPQQPVAEMTRPQIPVAENTRPQELPVQPPVLPVMPQPPVQPVMPQPPVQPVMPQPPVQPVMPQPPVQPVMPKPPVQPVAQGNASIKFYVSSLNTEVSVTRPSFTVGRDSTSDLSLSRLPNAKYIARRQATFFCSGGTWYIRDENSTNGTLLNHRKISGGQSHPLKLGDFISFAGKETLIVQELK